MDDRTYTLFAFENQLGEFALIQEKRKHDTHEDSNGGITIPLKGAKGFAKFLLEWTEKNAKTAE